MVVYRIISDHALVHGGEAFFMVKLFLLIEEEFFCFAIRSEDLAIKVILRLK